jgi:hypothetical protein
MNCCEIAGGGYSDHATATSNQEKGLLLAQALHSVNRIDHKYSDFEVYFTYFTLNNCGVICKEKIQEKAG